MARIDWLIEGDSFGNCNCDYGCPCQFESLPTHGGCKGFEAFHIDKGHFGDTRLDGLTAALFYAWPGPIFEGKGEIQAVISDSATPAQHEALTKILYGGETVEGANHWWVYAAMSEVHHPTLTVPITFEIDVAARKAHVSIPGLLTSTGRPIISPATGDEHRVRIDIPGGIEFDIAEIGSASSTIKGAIPMQLSNSYGQFNRLRQSGKGALH